MKKNWIAITLGMFGVFASPAQGMTNPTIGEIVKGGRIPEGWASLIALSRNAETQSVNVGENFVDNLRAALASTSPQMLALQTSLTDQGYDASGRDLTHKDQVTAALASQQKLTEQGYDASGTDLTHKDQVTAALASQQKLTDQGYDASGTDLTHKDQVAAALASQQKLTEQGYSSDGHDLISLTEHNQLSERAALLEQALGIRNVLPNVWTAVLASSLLTREVVSGISSENLLLSDEDIANHHNSGGSNPKSSSGLTALDKAKLLRSWIMHIGFMEYMQSDLDNFQIHLTDGDFYLGTNSGDPDHSLHLKLS